MIYLVEDDESIRELVIYTLQTTGLTAKGFPCAKDFWNAMKQEYPSLVLLDIMLPDEDGLTILKKLRDNGPTRRLPVIMLTAKGTEYDKVVGLDSGADDYIPKPFGMMELVSRVRALLRRTEPEKRADSCEAGAIHVDLNRHVPKNEPKQYLPISYGQPEKCLSLSRSSPGVVRRCVFLDLEKIILLFVIPF